MKCCVKCFELDYSNTSGYKFDTIADFDGLRVAVRQLGPSISDRKKE